MKTNISHPEKPIRSSCRWPGIGYLGQQWFKVIFEHGKLTRIELLPVSLSVAHVALARGEEFEAICARMEMLCAEFGTRLMRRNDRLVYEVCP